MSGVFGVNRPQCQGAPEGQLTTDTISSLVSRSFLSHSTDTLCVSFLSFLLPCEWHNDQLWLWLLYQRGTDLAQAGFPKSLVLEMIQSYAKNIMMLKAITWRGKKNSESCSGESGKLKMGYASSASQHNSCTDNEIDACL